MLTAAVSLKVMSPSTIAAITPLIAYLAEDYPDSPDYIQSACWPDDLKTLGVHVYDAFHFIDLPVVKGAAFFEVPAVGNSSNNPWAINEARDTLTSDYSITLDRARELRFIIHFVGDLHQPLHAATLMSPQFQPPVGDMGGNLFNITGAQETELHAFWDGGAELWNNDLTRPLNASGTAWLDGWVDTVMTAYPASSFAPELALTNPFDWAAESNGIAASFVYTAPQSPTPLSQQYINDSQAIVQQRVALGGYRLAHLLDSIFAAPTTAAAAVKKTHRIRGGRN